MADFDYDEYTRVLHDRQQAALEYATWALWDRKPVEDQDDISDLAREARRNLMDAAADRWAELNLRARTLLAQYQEEQARCL